MSYKWIGAVLVIAGCGGFGFSIAAGYRWEEMSLRQLLQALNTMQWELQYRLTPLPELCRQAGKETKGMLRDVFSRLAELLDTQTVPDADGCMIEAMKESAGLPKSVRECLNMLGHTLGRYDLPGQLQGIAEIRTLCRRALDDLQKDREIRLRSYETLGLCAGAALAILFL